VSARTATRARPRWVELLLAGPAGLASPLARVLVTLVIAAGAVCVLGSGVIHLYLWGKQYGYRDVPTIGPLFLLQGIVGPVLALAMVIFRRALLLAAGAMLLAGTAAGLLVSSAFGLFGFQESLAVPYATSSLVIEFTGAAVLAVAAVVALAARPRSVRKV
jgi:hypothetical protein